LKKKDSPLHLVQHVRFQINKTPHRVLSCSAFHGSTIHLYATIGACCHWNPKNGKRELRRGVDARVVCIAYGYRPAIPAIPVSLLLLKNLPGLSSTSK